MISDGSQVNTVRRLYWNDKTTPVYTPSLTMNNLLKRSSLIRIKRYEIIEYTSKGKNQIEASDMRSM
jgi:hypothetical protein